VALVADQEPVGALASYAAHPAFAMAFARGERAGVLITVVPSEVNTVSNAMVSYQVH
jgi:hypothetical protein